MRMNPTTYAHIKAIAGVRGVSIRQTMERAAQEHYENLPPNERAAVEAVLEIQEEESGPAEET